MKIQILETGTFKLDGGATFGVVPKSLWMKEYPADEKNLCTLALRCLLIETDGRLIIVDTGIGNKQDDSFFRHYYREGHHSVEKALNQAGYKAEDVTDVILSHLHFDHCGGAVTRNSDNSLVPTFRNAIYHISYKQWQWALNPNQREKASYLIDNFMPLFDKNLIHLIKEEGEIYPGVELRIFNGHTDGLIVPIVNYKGKKIVFTVDFIAMAPHLSDSWVCGFDTRPLISFDEKKVFLKEALENEYILLFEHDFYTECCTLTDTEKGIRADKKFKFSEI